MKKKGSVYRPKYFCICGRQATSVTNAGHALELYLCDECRDQLTDGKPIRLEIEKP
jgi:predicted SprT family Zn-dependent metalloprotease